MHKSTIALLLLQFLTFSTCRHPVVLVPGDGGSQMEAKLNKPAVVHYICDKTTNDYFNIWLNLELLVPLVIDCWVDNIRLVYNHTTRRTENSPGVDIRVPGFGNTTTVEYLDPSQASPGVYFKSVVETALLPLGYERNVSIRGAPYDFRKAPHEMEDWLDDFKKLIQDTYVANGNTSVILICHSMGSPLSLYFMHQQAQAWRDKYVRAMITLAGVWGGSVKALKVFAMGDDLGSYVLSSTRLRKEQRTSPSTAWLLPSRNFWDPSETLVTIKGDRNYTVSDFKYFFNDIDFNVGYEMMKDTQDLLGALDAPGVEIHCLHGVGVSTVERLDYSSAGYFPDKPTLVNGNGDGTVNVRSLRGCLRWKTEEDESDSKLLTRPSSSSSSSRLKAKARLKMKLKAAYGSNTKVYHQEYSGVDHMAILTDPQVLKDVKEAIAGINANSLKRRSQL